MPTKVYYHREANPAHELFVVKTNEDKTVNLALAEDAKPIITGCRVTAQPEFGSCTLAAPKAPTQKDAGEPLVDSVAEAPAKNTKK